MISLQCSKASTRETFPFHFGHQSVWHYLKTPPLDIVADTALCNSSHFAPVCSRLVYTALLYCMIWWGGGGGIVGLGNCYQVLINLFDIQPLSSFDLPFCWTTTVVIVAVVVVVAVAAVGVVYDAFSWTTYRVYTLLYERSVIIP